MTALRALAARFYALAFCLCMAFICVCNLSYFFDIKSWTNYWYLGFLLFGLGWALLINFILNDGVSFEHWIIAFIKRELPNGHASLASDELSDLVDAIKNWMPLLILGAAWLLEKAYGSDMSSLVIFAIGLAIIGFFSYREKSWYSQIPAWSIFLLSVFFPKSWHSEWEQKIGFSTIYILRVISLLTAVLGLQYRKPYFLKILFSVWIGQAILLILLAFCINSGLPKMGIKLAAGTEIKPIYVYSSFLLFAIIFGFPFALKTAFVGTVRMGVLETFIAECLDVLKVVAGFVILCLGATAAYDSTNHILLLIPITAILALYFGDVLEKKALDNY